MIQAAVLLLILANNHILFIKRNKHLKTHSGEVSFPGGKFDKKLDKSLTDTATREVYEEIGITPECYTILDKLPAQKTVSTNFLVHTFIARTQKNKLKYNINKKEVEFIITIPISHFYNNKYKVQVPIKINNKQYLNTFYYYKNILIWGATSRILDNFLEYYNDKLS